MTEPNEDSRTLGTQLFRYAVVGGVAFVADLGVLVALTELAGLHYLASAVVGFGAGVVVNYLLSVVWVFQQHTMRSRWAEFAVFLVLGIAGLGLNELSLFVLSGVLGVHYALAKVGATGVTFVWNFASRKLLLFTITSPTTDGPDSPTELVAVETVAQPVTG